jgi:hypothetical protein
VWKGYVSYSFSLLNSAGATDIVLSDSMPGGASSVTVQHLTFTLLDVDPATPPALNAAEPVYRVSEDHAGRPAPLSADRQRLALRRLSAGASCRSSMP